MHLPGFHPGFIFGGVSVVPLTSFVEVEELRVLADDSFQIDVPFGVEVGDLCVIWQRGSDTGSPPATVTPSGFTNAHDFTWTESGLGMRNIVSYKLLDGSEGGETLATMNQLAQLVVFRANRPLRTAIHAGAVQTRSTGNPAAVVVDAGDAIGASLVFATYWITGNGLIDPRTMVPDKDAEWLRDVFVGGTAMAWRFEVEGSGQNTAIDMDNESNRNWVTGFYFDLD